MKFQKSIGTIIGDENAIIDRTNLEIYRAIIARTQNSIPDDDFIVYRDDINKPGCYYNANILGFLCRSCHAEIGMF